MTNDARWRALVRAAGGRDLEPDIVDEIVEHADELFREQLAAGSTNARAQQVVERELADVPALARAARASQRRRLARPPLPPQPVQGAMSLPAAWGRDLAYGVRLLAARPSFTAVAVLTLALAIGANTAIFGVINSVLLEPLPFPGADRLVMLWEQDVDDQDLSIVAAPNYQDWARLATSFEHTAIWEYQTFNLSGRTEPEQVRGMRASASLFPMLGVAPQLGRTFTAEEDSPGHDVVVIADGLWRRRFGADPSVVGQTVHLNGRPFAIVGIMPPSFSFTRADDALWVPIQFTAQDEQRDAHSFYAAGRLKAGVGFETARVELDTIGRQLAAEYESNVGETATITRMDELGVGDLRPTLFTLLAAVAVVLLIACVNVANLLLAQASVRRREFAIRTALGAGRGRLASQLLAEGLVLAVAGGVVGLLLAWLVTAALTELLPSAVRLAPFREPGMVPLDPMVLAFTFAVAASAGVLFSLAPALGMTRVQPDTAMKTAGDRGRTGRLTWVRGALVAGEIALALILLVGAGLLVKSMARLVQVDPGLDPSHVLTMTMALPQPDTYGAPERTTLCEDVTREVGALPGVVTVGAISHLPLSGANAGRGFTIDGRPPAAPNEGASAFYRVTCPGYFRTLGIPVVAGRDFDGSDSLMAPLAVIINESTAARYWPGEDPLGKRIKFGDDSSSAPWQTVVGVVRDVRHFGLDTNAYREIYRPYSQVVWPVMTVTVKTATAPMTMASSVRASLQRIDANQPVSRVRSMDRVLDESLGVRTFPMRLLGLFSLVSLALAAIGVYGVIGCLVAQRTREIGIRMALGAGRAAVTRMVVGRSLIPIGVGIVAGVAGALAATRLLEAMLFGVQPSDPWVLAAIVVLLGTAAVAASYLPARRAASVDPLVVLRVE